MNEIIIPCTRIFCISIHRPRLTHVGTSLSRKRSGRIWSVTKLSKFEFSDLIQAPDNIYTSENGIPIISNSIDAMRRADSKCRGINSVGRCIKYTFWITVSFTLSRVGVLRVCGRGIGRAGSLSPKKTGPPPTLSSRLT
jgi:hypothetical protein